LGAWVWSVGDFDESSVIRRHVAAEE
jgi:hypothetical protein